MTSTTAATEVEPAGGERPRRLGHGREALVGLGALVCLLAGAVGVAVFLIADLEGDTSYLAERHVQYATAIHDAALDAKAIANHERGFLISGDPEFVRELEERTTDARAAFAAARSYAVEPEEQAAAERAGREFERWLGAVDRDLAAYRAGFEQRAVRSSLGPTRELRKRYERSLARAHALGLRSIETATTSVSTSAARSVTVLLVYLAVSLAVGIAVAVWAVRTLLEPTHELTSKALDILMQARVLVEEDARGSHHAVKVELPIEAVNELAETALEAQDSLGGRRAPTD